MFYSPSPHFPEQGPTLCPQRLTLCVGPHVSPLGAMNSGGGSTCFPCWWRRLLHPPTWREPGTRLGDACQAPPRTPSTPCPCSWHQAPAALRACSWGARCQPPLLGCLVLGGFSWGLQCLVLGVGPEREWYPSTNTVPPRSSYINSKEQGVERRGSSRMPRGRCLAPAFCDLFRKWVS